MFAPPRPTPTHDETHAYTYTSMPLTQLCPGRAGHTESVAVRPKDGLKIVTSVMVLPPEQMSSDEGSFEITYFV